MHIKKIGHCALVLEDRGVKILTDPGTYTIDAQQKETGLDAILITHEHQDHLHIESIAALLTTNPHAKVISNSAVAKLLKEKGIECEVVGDGQSTTVKALVIEGFGKDHAPIYETMGLVENTGYMVGGSFYFPGDNFHEPGKAVDVLALPVAGPWLKLSMVIDFAKAIKARTAFGVHDGIVAPASRGFVYMFLKKLVPETDFVELKDGETKQF